MKIPLVPTLLGLAISFAFPTIAQQTSAPDPQLREKLVAAIKKHTDALDKNDATAVAANFTENGILVTPDGPTFGREHIEEYYKDVFKQVQLSGNLAPADDNSPHAISNVDKENVGNRKMECFCQRPEFRSDSSQGLLVSDSRGRRLEDTDADLQYYSSTGCDNVSDG
jgi:hypothetical protein